MAHRIVSMPIRRAGNTIFIPLPKNLQRPCDGCCCPYCTADHTKPNPNAMWDTIALSANPEDGDMTWVVHAPEYHGKVKLREKE